MVNVFVRNLVDRLDARRLEVVAIDTTLVCPVRQHGTPRLLCKFLVDCVPEAVLSVVLSVFCGDSAQIRGCPRPTSVQILRGHRPLAE